MTDVQDRHDPTSRSPLGEPEELRRRLRLPIGAGLSTCHVNESTHEVAPLPAALGRAVAKRQCEYLAGRRCASAALSMAGYPEQFYPAMGEDRLPIWPSGWLGSISHSGDYAIAAAAPQQLCAQLGIDIQQQVSQTTVQSIQSLIASPEELASVASIDVDTRLLLIFSAKESLYKALYPQVRKIQEFHAAKLIASDVGALLFELACDWSAQWKAGARIAVNYVLIDDYIMTSAHLGVAIQGAPSP